MTTVDVNGVTLHYRQAGSGPDVVLLPGLGATLHVWDAQVRGLASVLRLTAVDPRGHGRSSRPPGPYAIAGLADDAAGLIESLGLAPAVVVASSLSTLTAVELAARYPERVSALVLVGGFPRLAPAVRARMEERARLVEAEGMEPLAELVPATAFGALTQQQQPGLVGLFRQVILDNDPAAYAASIRALLDADVTARLGEVACPTLVLLGEQEQVAPLSAARDLAAGLRRAEVRVLPGCGHLPFLEQPAAFNAALLEFVARLPLATAAGRDR